MRSALLGGSNPHQTRSKKVDPSPHHADSRGGSIHFTPHRGHPGGGFSGSAPQDRGNYGGGGSGGGPGHWRFRKLDMPLFDGSDPDGWIMRVERYFGFYGLTKERLEAVVVALEGDALRWYQWENKRHPIRRWDDLRTFVLR